MSVNRRKYDAEIKKNAVKLNFYPVKPSQWMSQYGSTDRTNSAQHGGNSHDRFEITTCRQTAIARLGKFRPFGTFLRHRNIPANRP